MTDAINAIRLILSPNTKVVVGLHESDGEFVVEYGKDAVTVTADMPDDFGRGDEIYCERLTGGDDGPEVTEKSFPVSGQDYNVFSVARLPNLPQRQDCLENQVNDLIAAGNRLGLHEASDFLDRCFKVAGGKPILNFAVIIGASSKNMTIVGNFSSEEDAREWATRNYGAYGLPRSLVWEVLPIKDYP